MVGPCFDHVSQASQAPIATANAGIIQITDMRRERRVVARGTAARCSRTSLITRLPSTPDGFGIITHADAECRARRWAGQPEPGFPIGQIARSWRVRLCISGKTGFPSYAIKNCIDCYRLLHLQQICSKISPVSCNLRAP